jgi:4-amino-4-deoxy-L-arabinose transferase-like glycosyltransferase
MGSSIEIFYAASVRSMSASWHDFFYAAFDPAGTVSIDKLPGALWIQALAVRAFGVHTWVVDLPQAVEGILTVLVLYRAVRRLAGPGPGVAAAFVLAISPATVTLDRGNISDTLLVLLLVLAANSVVSSLVTGNLRHLLVAGLWVGLAFQAKMIEAWFVVPALAIAYLVASRTSIASRVLQVAAMGVVVIVVSLSWMTLVSLTPASSDRTSTEARTTPSSNRSSTTTGSDGWVSYPRTRRWDRHSASGS